MPRTTKPWRYPRHNTLAPWASTFFDTLHSTGNVSAASRASRTPIQTLYDRRRRDAAFAAAWDDAVAVGLEVLKGIAVQRAERGYVADVRYTAYGDVGDYSNALINGLITSHSRSEVSHDDRLS